MSHKAAFMLGRIDRSEFDELSMLKQRGSAEAYERRERELGASRSQLVERYGEDKVEDAERRFGRARQMAVEHIEGQPRAEFGTRRDGRVYPKERGLVTLDFRGRV